MNILPAAGPNPFPIRKIVPYLLIILVLGLLIRIVWQWDRENRFDRATWLTHANDRGDNPRLKMVPDLVSNHLRPGRTRPEVVTLLGKPDQEEKRRTEGLISDLSPADDARIDHIYIYNLGAPWFDGVALYIGFDKTDRLVGTWQVQY